MKRFILAPPAALFALIALSASPAAAQYTYPLQPPRYGPGYTPLLSPWLNMLRGGDPAANYFLGVEPEFQRRQDRNALYGQVQGLSNLLPARPQIREGDIDTPLPSTGHATAFGYTGSYFGTGPQISGRSPGNPFPQRGAQQPAGRWPSYNTTPSYGMPQTSMPPIRR
jgi:hypothetical protein